MIKMTKKELTTEIGKLVYNLEEFWELRRKIGIKNNHFWQLKYWKKEDLIWIHKELKKVAKMKPKIKDNILNWADD